MNPRPLFTTLEGVVKSVTEKALWFREGGASHDICIPLSQVRDGECVKVGDIQVDATKWILTRLEEEGKR